MRLVYELAVPWDLHTVVFMRTHSCIHESTQTIFIDQRDPFRLVCFYILLLFFHLLEDVKDKLRVGKGTREKISDYESVFLRVLCLLTAVLELRFHSPVCHRKLNVTNTNLIFTLTFSRSVDLTLLTASHTWYCLATFKASATYTTVPFWQTHDTHRGPVHLSLHWHSSYRGRKTASSIEHNWPAPAPCKRKSQTLHSKHVQVRLYGAWVECCVLEDNIQREKSHTHWQN